MPNPRAITLRQLRTLAAIEDCGSLSHAAEALGLTPPAIHSQLKSLEDNIGSQLVIRGRNAPARLTGDGRALAATLARFDDTLEHALRQIGARRRGKAGVVTLGVVSTAKYFMPQLVARLQTAFPRIEVDLKVGNRDAMIAMLRGQNVDLVIMGRPPRDPPVTARVLCPHPHVIIAAPDHPLAGRHGISASDLLRETFLTREPGSGTRILMSRYLDRIGEGQPYRTREMGSNETIKQAVIAGLGIALISGHTVREELASGRLALIPFSGLPIMRSWYLMHYAEKVPQQAAETVRSFLQAEISGVVAPDHGE